MGTPASPNVNVSVTSQETLLIAFAIAVMLLIATLFLLGVWYFLNRLKREQDRVSRIEQRDAGAPGTGSKPDTPRPGRDFTPQADMHVPDDS